MPLPNLTIRSVKPPKGTGFFSNYLIAILAFLIVGLVLRLAGMHVPLLLIFLPIWLPAVPFGVSLFLYVTLKSFSFWRAVDYTYVSRPSVESTDITASMTTEQRQELQTKLAEILKARFAQAEKNSNSTPPNNTPSDNPPA